MRPTRIQSGLAALAGVLLSLSVSAGSDAVEVSQAWSRATPPGVAVGAAFMQLKNKGHHGDRLVGVSSPVADRVEVHETLMENGVMKMRQRESLSIDAGKSVSLQPGGLHIMLLDLKRPLAANSSIPLHLQFENAGMVMVNVKVGEMGADAPMAHGDHGSMDHSKMDHGSMDHSGMDHSGMKMDKPDDKKMKMSQGEDEHHGSHKH